MLYTIETSIGKPDYFVYESKYIQWLQQLITTIKKIDAVHPVIVSVIWNDHADKRLQLYKNYVDNLNEFVLKAEREKGFSSSLQLPGKFSWCIADPSLWDGLLVQHLIIPSWQDQQTSGFASLNGLLDLQGRKKQTFSEVDKRWNSRGDENVRPAIQILKPAKLPSEGQTLRYHALIKDGSGNYVFASKNKMQIRFEWYLVHTDPYGNELSVKHVGDGETLDLNIPAFSSLYYLYLEAISNNTVTTIKSPLGVPIFLEKAK